MPKRTIIVNVEIVAEHQQELSDNAFDELVNIIEKQLAAINLDWQLTDAVKLTSQFATVKIWAMF